MFLAKNPSLIDETPKVIVQRALPLVREVFALDFNDGVHGLAHWSRVWHHGKAMAAEFDVNPRIPAWFAFLHDCQRENDVEDPGHGSRAADFAVKLRDQGQIGLSKSEFDALCYAMQKHSDGHIEAEKCIQICWDADRLDLGRVGVEPDPQYLCTKYARRDAVIDAAYDLSQRLSRHTEILQQTERPRSLRI